jgi:hypothetical protein
LTFRQISANPNCLSGPRIIPDLVPAKTLAAEAVQTAAAAVASEAVKTAAAVASEAVQTAAIAVAMPPETGGEAVVNAPAFRIPCEARAAASIWLCLRCGSQVLAVLQLLCKLKQSFLYNQGLQISGSDPDLNYEAQISAFSLKIRSFIFYFCIVLN